MYLYHHVHLRRVRKDDESLDAVSGLTLFVMATPRSHSRPVTGKRPDYSLSHRGRRPVGGTTRRDDPDPHPTSRYDPPPSPSTHKTRESLL